MKGVEKGIKLLRKNFHWLILAFIIYVGVYIRLGTLNIENVLDYDPWWYFRHTKYLLENNFRTMKWDLLSYFPPGRPMIDPWGWEYMVAISYKILSLLFPIDFVRFAIWSPALMAGLIAIPAYFTGKIITNKWGGLATAFFAVLTPTLLGVSMAGYMDTDALVVFFTFASVAALLHAIEKRTKFSYAIAILTLWLFAFSWVLSWYVLYIFVGFLFMYFAASNSLSFILKRSKGESVNVESTSKTNLDVESYALLGDIEFKLILKALIIVTACSSVLAIATGRPNPLTIFTWGLNVLKGTLIVNVSIAELQPINIFTKGGFLQVANRTGISLYFAFLLPAIILFKIWKRQRIRLGELFAFVWLGATFYLILHGVRFSLLFASATIAAGGFVIGNVVEFVKRWKGAGSRVMGSTLLGVIFLLLFMELSSALQYSSSLGGMDISDNWIGMLDWLKENADEKATVATWWDPGHIIAGYTGLAVHADGAHCPPSVCIPYNHNVRIQNMGRIMSTSDEGEAVALLEKYMGLTPEQCQEVKREFGDIVPEEACEPASEMYFIASNDLIGKFTWMNYFGGYRAPISSNVDFARNPGVCCASTPDTEPGQMSCGEFANQGRGVWVWCPWVFSFSNVQQDRDGNPIYVYDYGGLKIALIQKEGRLIPVYNNQFIINHINSFSEGQVVGADMTSLETSLEKIDGLVWVQPDFRSLIYFAPSIRDSVFVKLFFFNGEGLDHFELVYSNPEIRLYRVNF